MLSLWIIQVFALNLMLKPKLKLSKSKCSLEEKQEISKSHEIAAGPTAFAINGTFCIF